MPRTREFDTEATLERCLELFWSKSFSGVSLSDLESATGVGRQSLYTAFGNKEAILAVVMDLYMAKIQTVIEPLLSPTAGLNGTARIWARRIC